MKPLAPALAGLLTVLATACSGDTAASGSLGPASGEGDDGWPFAVEELDRLDEPWAMAFLPDTGDLLITERSGTLHLRDAEVAGRDIRPRTTAVVRTLDLRFHAAARAGDRPP